MREQSVAGLLSPKGRVKEAKCVLDITLVQQRSYR